MASPVIFSHAEQPHTPNTRGSDSCPTPKPDRPDPQNAERAQCNHPNTQPGSNTEKGKPIRAYTEQELDWAVLACIAPGRTREQIQNLALTRLGFERRGKKILAALNAALDRAGV